MHGTHLSAEDIVWLLIYSDDFRASVIEMLLSDPDYRAEVEEALARMPQNQFPGKVH